MSFYSLILAAGNAVVQSAPAAAPAATPAAQTAANAAPAAQEGAAGGLMSFLPIILIMIVFFFFMSRGQKKQQQKRQQMLDSIVKGTEVMLASGIYGKIDSVLNDAYIVEIAANTKIKIAKAGIAEVIVKQEETAAKKEETK